MAQLKHDDGFTVHVKNKNFLTNCITFNFNLAPQSFINFCILFPITMVLQIVVNGILGKNTY
jgi:hypothetical protein